MCCSHVPKLVLIMIITWHFQFCQISDNILLWRAVILNQEWLHMLPHCYIIWCTLLMAIFTLRYPLSWTVKLVTQYLNMLRPPYIGVFRYSDNDSTVISLAGNKSAITTESYDDDVDMKKASNLTVKIMLIGVEGMSGTSLCYTYEYWILVSLRSWVWSFN